MMASRHALRILAMASVAYCGVFTTPLAAQETGAGSGDGAIVVTARRREESLLDVPIAVTAISGDTLERTGAIDITDISNSAPNVTLETSRGTNSTLTAFIRGVGQQDPVAGFEAGVGLYLDDVYLNRPQAAVLDIYDVERIEVLRGPQGTLYGRNTIGGAVKYVTKRLGDDPMLKIRGTYGSYNQADGVITASVPVGDGTLKFGGALARLSRGGFGDNLTTGQDNYNKDVWAGRLTAQVEAKDAFFRLTGDYTKDKSNPRGGHRLIPGLFTGAPVLSDVYDTRAGLLDPKQVVEAWGVSLFAELKPTDMLTVRSISAYRKDDSATPIDFDSLAAVDVDVPAFYNNKQFSQELQLLIDAGGLQGLIGGYFLDANARTAFDVRLPNGVTALTFGDVDTETFAIFGDFTYDFSPMFSASVGGRYTWDKRSSTILRQTFLGGGSPFFGGNGLLFATTSSFTGDNTFKEFTPRASVSFKPSPDHTLYASYSKGFKGGGFDPRGVSTAAPDTNRDGTRSYQEIFDFLSFDPETVNSYEVGYKASLFDRRLTMALAAFHADYSDVQVPGSVGTVINGQQTFIGVTTNAGKARIRGIEYEGNLAIARDFGREGDRLGFNWALGYIDAKYTRFIDSRGIDVSDRRKFQNTPKWTASGTLSYNTPVGGGSINASSTLAYRSASQQFEAGGVAPSYAVIAEYFPSHERARALSIYSLGIPLGSAAGVLLGGYVAALVEWRTAFLVVGIAGIVIAPLFRLIVREPQKGQFDAVPVEKAPMGAVFGILARKPSFWLISFGASFSSMCGYGIAFWLPSLMQRSFGLDLVQTSQFYGAVLLLGGIVGVLAGGWLGDYLGARNRGNYVLLPAVAYLLAIPFFAAGVLSSSVTAAFLLFLLPQALSYIWIGPVLSAVQHLVPPQMRASASASFLFINNLIGIGLGTMILGALSDGLTARFGVEALRYAILSALIFYAIAALLMALAAKSLRKDWVG